MKDYHYLLVFIWSLFFITSVMSKGIGSFLYLGIGTEVLVISMLLHRKEEDALGKDDGK